MTTYMLTLDGTFFREFTPESEAEAKAEMLAVARRFPNNKVHLLQFVDKNVHKIFEPEAAVSP